LGDDGVVTIADTAESLFVSRGTLYVGLDRHQDASRRVGR
jgi:hypothetical protein